MKSRTVLAIAVLCGVGGLLLKLSDLHGRSGAPAPSTPAPPGERAGEPRRAAGGADYASVPPGEAALEPEDARSPGDERPAAGSRAPDGAPAPAAPHRDGTFGWIGDTRRAVGTPTHREHGSKRDRMVRVGGGGSGAPGLTAAETGAGGDGGLATAGHGGTGVASPAAGSSAVPSGVAPVPATAEPDVTTPQGTQYATNTQIQVPIGKMTGQAGAMSFTIDPAWQEGNKDDVSFLNVGDGRLTVFKNVNFLRFEFTDDAGNTNGIGVPIDQWKQGEAHQVTTTWVGNHFYLYVDGQPVSDKIVDSQTAINFPKDSTLAIGSAFPEGRPVAPGTIGNVDLSGRPLSQDAVLRHYEQWLASQAAGQNPTAAKGKTAAR